MIRLTILLSLVSLWLSCSPKAELMLSQLKETNYPDTLDFTLTEHNNILINAVLNKQDSLLLMLHTDASDVSITEVAHEKISQSLDTESSEAKSWGGGGEIKSAVNNHIKIGKSNWDSQTIWVNQNSGPGSDGKFGPALFKNKYVEVNHDINQIIIHDQILTPLSGESYQQYELEMKNHSMYITGSLNLNDSIYHHQFLIHSGYGGTILIDDGFASTHQLNDQLNITSESELKDSFGNVLKTKKAIIPEFILADQSFYDMPIGFFEGQIGPSKISVIGGELLKRFNIIFALHEAIIYMKPNKYVSVSFPYAQ